MQDLWHQVLVEPRQQQQTECGVQYDPAQHPFFQDIPTHLSRHIRCLQGLQRYYIFLPTILLGPYLTGFSFTNIVIWHQNIAFSLLWYDQDQEPIAQLLPLSPSLRRHAYLQLPGFLIDEFHFRFSGGQSNEKFQ